MRSLYAGPPLKELHEEYAKKGKIDEDALKDSDRLSPNRAAVIRRILSDYYNLPT